MLTTMETCRSQNSNIHVWRGIRLFGRKDVLVLRLDQLFLENKQNLDQASYKLLRVSQQGLAFELYHRIVANESSIEELSLKYGEGSEKFHGGFFKLQNVEDLPNGIAHLLLKLDVGQCTKPLAMNRKFGILKLEEFVPAVRGDSLDKRVLERQFQMWVNGMSDHLCAHLKSVR